MTPQIQALEPKVRQFTKRCMIGALALMSLWSYGALAQDGHSHTLAPQQTVEQQRKASALIKAVREATERFKDV
jgi:hypothetical protein